uniref:Uncharacterized protein n=1 Tax=Anguilla anguilla TaxID=7936 RepID=A0A0E9SRD6_ANGAN
MHCKSQVLREDSCVVSYEEHGVDSVDYVC